MDLDRDRPHFGPTTTTTTTTNNNNSTEQQQQQVFICFSSSRLSSSSSMKLTKSILSPARAARDPSSLSRRNGSIKGGASPFFNTKKRGGSAFDNPEPSSPKVTCIGQVRVKTKKKVRQKTRSLSRRKEVASFRKNTESDLTSSIHSSSRSNYQKHKQECFPNRTTSSSSSSHGNGQKWAYFPSICEGFSCLFPCGKSSSSCFSSRGRSCEEKRDSCVDENGCGAVFTRWLVSVNDGDKRREIELMVGGGDEEEHHEQEDERRMSRRSSRRHVFEDIQVKDDGVVEINNNNNNGRSTSCFVDDGLEEEEEKGRVSICVPPKNALLLMRCRSDPMKVAALASRFSWDANAVNLDDDGGLDRGGEAARYSVDGFVREFQQVQGKDEIFMGMDSLIEANEVMMPIEQEASLVEGNEIIMPIGTETCLVEEANEMIVPTEAEASLVEEASEMIVPIEAEAGSVGLGDINNGHEKEEEEEEGSVAIGGEEMVEDDAMEREIGEAEEVESNMSSFEALLDQENSAAAADHEEEEEVEQQVAESSSPFDISSSSTDSDSEQEDEDEDDSECSELPAALESADKLEKDAIFDEKVNSVEQFVNPEKERKEAVLPDCLLLMMCEPKLSMEVSKETWVCSTDFIRWLPDRPAKKSGKTGSACTHKKGESNKPKQQKIDSNAAPPALPPPVQPRRSSCSLPPKGPSMAVQIEQKLVNSAANYEPLVLTRCKSEPMRTAASKLMPESFYWKNAIRKLDEPHRRATLKPSC